MTYADSHKWGFTLTQLEKKNWFYEGQETAKREYSGGGTMVGGFVAGMGLGLIGWGIGYAITSNMAVDVPGRHTAELSTEDRQKFQDGYTEYVKKQRKSRFNVGAGIGTLLIVLLLVSSSGD